MKIRQINTEKPRDRRRFIEFPFNLYQDSPYWVPPLVSDVQFTLNRSKHPFYQHSEADFFIAESEGETLGRIAILNNRHYCEYKKEETALFYYFDVVEDGDAARALLQAATDWAKERGLKHILGPKGFLRSSGMGLLVDGFDSLPAMSIPYNYPYYESYLLDGGFKSILDMYSGYLESREDIDPRVHQIADKVKQRGNFWIKDFRHKAEVRYLLPMIKKVQDDAFLDNPNYYPSTDEEFALMADSLMQISRPGMIKIIMKGDDVAGFIISYPNINKALQKTRGRMWPFGWYALLREKKHTTIVDCNGVGILPKYQGLGANALLYSELAKTLQKYNYQWGELVQVNESNFKSRSDWENIGVHVHKLHRTYKLDIQ